MMKNKEQINDGFKIPNGYFNQLKRDILNKTVQVNDGLLVPDGYFDELKQQILTKKAEREKMKPLYTQRPIIWRYAAAAAVIVVSVGTLLHLFNSNTEFNTSLKKTDTDVLMHYIEQHGTTEDAYYLISDETHETPNETDFIIFDSSFNL